MSRAEGTMPDTVEAIAAELRELETKLAQAPPERRERLLDDIARLKSYAVLKELGLMGTLAG
jgi:hypothetical protein